METHGFFDESGTHDGSPVLCVAGYIISNECLDEFNQRWFDVLDDYGLSHFHMVDGAHGRGEFSYLDKKARIDTQTKLIKLIRQYIERGIGAMVVSEVYQNLMPFHPNMGSAYNYCIWHCLEAVKLWREELALNAGVHFMFEQGHKSDGEADRILTQSFTGKAEDNVFGYLSHKFVDKKATPGVQAADILAWQMYTDWRHGMEGKPRRGDFKFLISDKKHRVCVIDAKRIQYHVERMKALNAWDEASR